MSRLLIEHWDGSRWSIQRTPAPVGSMDSFLSEVSCRTRAACMAVGSFDKRAGGSLFPLADHWNGSRWSIEPIARPELGELQGVSCAAPSVCSAVGDRPAGTLVERWSRGKWSPESTPRASHSLLRAVSCSSSTNCTAVGERPPRGGCDAEQLIEHWDGLRWTVEQAPRLGSCSAETAYFGSTLAGVSCASTTACAAVGSTVVARDVGTPVVERMQGRRWRSDSDPALEIPDVINAVSCPAANACTAVGHLATGAGVIRWDGRRWTVHKAAGKAELIDVSCTSSTACTAVGSTPNPSPFVLRIT